MHRRVVVVAGGEPEQFPFDSLGHFDFCIAADAGLERARDLGLNVDLVIGDMDSVSEEALERARSEGVSVEIHPVDKDASDLELALEVALQHSPDELFVVGGSGGRLDHSVLTVALIASIATRSPARIVGLVGGWVIEIASAQRPWSGRGSAGDGVSLVPQGGDAHGVITTGLRFPLAGESLGWGSSRGLSNSFEADEAAISVEAGVLLVLRPQKEGFR